jgi:hypothetical protein
MFTLMRHLALVGAAFALVGCAALRSSHSTPAESDCSLGPPVQRPTVITATDTAFTITGIVRNAATLKGLRGARVLVDEGPRTLSDSAGVFRLELNRKEALPTRLYIFAAGFESHLHPIRMSADAGLRLEIFMTSRQVCEAK